MSDLKLENYEIWLQGEMTQTHIFNPLSGHLSSLFFFSFFLNDSAIKSVTQYPENTAHGAKPYFHVNIENKCYLAGIS